ncbi:hypothetical protein QYM36_000674 [Artemia franciscana]|uniref:Uncharacterized protein n=1 Tax=Artemia franciscana TaxID=6661 RepID=A0AA88IDK0_ARTSF|nr:hypothetical protein QYM36_000674 [Artemia franciscana]
MRKFAYDPTLAAATLIDPIFGANSLTQDEFADAVSLINELSRFSHQFWKNGDSFNERSEADSVGVLNTELSSSSLLRDSGDGLLEDDLPDIPFDDTPDEEEEELQQL